MDKQILKIAIIVTDEVLESLNNKEFYSLYDNFIRGYGQLEHLRDNVEIITDRYSAVSKEWPVNPNEYHGYIITGSASSAYDSDEWITILKQRIVELDNNEIKICGICFGHQVIAEALGGKVIKNPLGWELGQHNINIQSHSIDILHNLINDIKVTSLVGNDSANSSRSNSPILINDGASVKKDTISILQIHQDHVSIVPEGMIVVASTEKSNVQAMLKESKSVKGRYHIITFQGHPEFDRDFTHLLISNLKGQDPIFINDSLNSLKEKSCQPWLSNLVYNFFLN